MKNFLLCILAVCLLVICATAQQPVDNKAKTDQAPAPVLSKERRGTIKGRVVSDSGQPLTNVNIRVYAVAGVSQNIRSEQSTDEDGKFEIDDLSPAIYSIVPSTPGYILSMNANERQYYRIGDDVTLTMIKGGVITGMVKNAAGEPVVGVIVSASRVRDAEGKPSTRSISSITGYRRDRMTDDRGIYRIYGIEPGAYIVAAGAGDSFYMTRANKYADDVKTYHPSSTRETATEVMVQNGQEASDIDINYRGGKGRAISGTVSGARGVDNAIVSVSLIHTASGVSETSTGAPMREGKTGFALYGVPDGDYLLRAELITSNPEKNNFVSQSRRIIVKDNDVSGIELALAPFASISGALVLEPPVANSKVQCEKTKLATLEETMITFRKDTKNDTLEQKWLNASSPLAPNDKGEFTAYRLFPGNYHMSVNLPGETWYVKSIALSTSLKNNQPNDKSQQLSDVATKGIAVKAGEQVATVTVTITEGAANFRGMVKAVSERKALPPRLYIYLIPSERENANDVLRFFQSEVQFDGAFSFTNIPPGKYWVLSRTSVEENLSDNLPRPIYWDLQGRTLLIKEATAANSLLELQPCKKITDYSLRHGLPQATVIPVIKK